MRGPRHVDDKRRQTLPIFYPYGNSIGGKVKKTIKGFEVNFDDVQTIRLSCSLSL